MDPATQSAAPLCDEFSQDTTLRTLLSLFLPRLTLDSQVGGRILVAVRWVGSFLWQSGVWAHSCGSQVGGRILVARMRR